jgi:MarR family transcriptional regulator, negative regulator of the multidrug operon emrRAB
MHTTAWDDNVLGAFGLALADRLAAAAEPAGGATAAEALVALGGTAAGASTDALARVVGLSHSGTVRLVDRLARDGLVERRRGADQRSAALVLTPAGRRLARRVMTRRNAEMHSVVALLTAGEQKGLMRAAEHAMRELGVAPEAERRLCRLCDLEACQRQRGRCPVMTGQTRGSGIQTLNRRSPTK